MNDEDYEYCSECGYAINNGEAYYELGGEKICEDCMNDNYRHIMDYDTFTREDYLTEKYERERHDDN